MAYQNDKGQKQYTMKEKYSYYKNMADSGKKEDGTKIGLTARIGAANRANAIRRRMGKNKANYDYMQEQLCGSNSKKIEETEDLTIRHLKQFETIHSKIQSNEGFSSLTNYERKFLEMYSMRI